MQEELKPCPFCGGNEMGIEKRWGSHGTPFVFVECYTCRNQTGVYGCYSYEETEDGWYLDEENDKGVKRAINAWNRRKQ